VLLDWEGASHVSLLFAPILIRHSLTTITYSIMASRQSAVIPSTLLQRMTALVMEAQEEGKSAGKAESSEDLERMQRMLALLIR
jgi:hypothetical protein